MKTKIFAAFKIMLQFLIDWPTIIATPIFAVLFIYSFPAVDYINFLAQQVAGGHELEFSASFFQIIFSSIFIAIICGDLAQLGIGIQAPWLFKYLLNRNLCTAEFFSMSATSRQWLLFAYMALFMFILSQFAG